MAEAEFVDYSLTPSERNYVDMRSTLGLSSRGKFTRRDALLALVAITCVYLLNGRFAAHACTVLTSVPAALFTYKVLSEESSTQKGYRSILFYWVLQGGLGLLDVVLSDSYGYILAKLVLMALAFGNAASQNKDAFSKMVNTESLKDDFTQCMTSIVSRYDSEGFAVQSPPIESGSSVYMESAATACPIHSDDISMMSTQKETPVRFRHGLNRALTPHPDAFLEDDDLGSGALPQDSHCTVGLAYGDLISNPLEKVVFKQMDETKVITVANMSQTHNVMWALKCNALHRLAASPACGVIRRGEKEEISVMCREGMQLESEGDKLAIDYALVGEETSYRTNFTDDSTEKRRHLLRVNFDFQ